MTREEAIDVLKHTIAYESDFAEAKRMAIEALSAPQTDLISRADAIETVRKIAPYVIDKDTGQWEILVNKANVITELSALLSAEAVEVVRCKDCKYWHSNTEFCSIWSFHFQNVAQRTLADDYCSRGERKGGDDE